MKIVYRGGYNKRDPESVKNSTIFEYLPIIKNLYERGQSIAVVTLAKPDGYYDELLLPIRDKVDVIGTPNIENVTWGKYDLIILMGGDTPTLQSWLRKGKFSLNQFKEKSVIVGDSAGALVLCPYYYDGQPDDIKVKWYQGMNPGGNILVLVHANNPHYAPEGLFPLVQQFAKDKNLTVVKINENQSYLSDDNQILEIKPADLQKLWD